MHRKDTIGVSERDIDDNDKKPVFAANAVLVGGALNTTNDNSNGARWGHEIYRRFIEEAMVDGSAMIGVITSSSGDPEGQGIIDVERFTTRGAFAEWIPLTETNISKNSDPDIIAQINRMTGFYFAGGDQSRYIRALYNSDGSTSLALQAIVDKVKAGAPIAGTSAGTVVQTSGPMITGGAAFNSLAHPSQTYQPLQTTVTSSDDFLNYRPEGGLSLFPFGLLDTHFSERGRQCRFIRLAAETGTRFAFGIDENTALVVKNRLVEVIGENGVFIFDLGSATHDVRADGGFSISGVKATYLNRGDQYAPSTRAVTFGNTTDLNTTLNTVVSPSADIFGAGEFLDLATRLMQSPQTEAIGKSVEPGNTYFRITLSKTWTTEGKQNADGSQVSFKDLMVDVELQ